MTPWPEADRILARYEDAIDTFERAVRGCSDEPGAAPLWEVRQTDPWVWPKEGVEPVPARTVESIQAYSATWYVAAHCAFFLDFYLSGPDDFTVQSPFEPVAEEGWEADGAIELPKGFFTQEEVLTYIAHGRAKARVVIPALTEADVQRTIPDGHPWAGATYGQLLRVNLKHVIEHGEQIQAHTA